MLSQVDVSVGKGVGNLETRTSNAHVVESREGEADWGRTRIANVRRQSTTETVQFGSGHPGGEKGAERDEIDGESRHSGRQTGVESTGKERPHARGE